MKPIRCHFSKKCVFRHAHKYAHCRFAMLRGSSQSRSYAEGNESKKCLHDNIVIYILIIFIDFYKTHAPSSSMLKHKMTRRLVIRHTQVFSRSLGMSRRATAAIITIDKSHQSFSTHVYIRILSWLGNVATGDSFNIYDSNARHNKTRQRYDWRERGALPRCKV